MKETTKELAIIMNDSGIEELVKAAKEAFPELFYEEKKFDTHTQTYKIVVEDKSKIEEVKQTILSFDWVNYKKHQSAPSISKNDILRLFLNGA